ncbi:MAG: tetratricopeptide repeat protein [Saprospiraceae bacterium]
MKRNTLFLALFCFLLAACSTSKVSLNTPTNNLINQQMTDKKGNPHLIGVSNVAGLQQAPFGDWYDKNYADYSPDNEVLSKCKKAAQDVEVVAFMATWCGDSKREVPRFYKAMEQLKIGEERIKLVNVYRDSERYKQSPTGEEKGLNIHRVPTFIFYKNGEEIGRIVESPKTSMDVDIAQILTGLASSPRYEMVTRLNQEFTNNEHETIKEKYERWGRFVARNTTSLSELNTYGYVLATQKKLEEAIIVFTINTLAYPQEARAFSNLGEAYQEIGEKELAIKNYEKALELNPEYESAQKALAELTS